MLSLLWPWLLSVSAYPPSRSITPGLGPAGSPHLRLTFALQESPQMVLLLRAQPVFGELKLDPHWEAWQSVDDWGGGSYF